MQEILELAAQIRKIVIEKSDVLLQDTAVCHQRRSSLDVIEDTDYCLEAFLTKDIEGLDEDGDKYVIEDTDYCLEAFLTKDIEGLDEDGNKYVLATGTKYMYVYGTLQALFVQQDAVKHLAESLQIPYTCDPSLKEIREIRNDSVGHPTKRGKGSAFNFISRVTIDNQGFKLSTAYADGRDDFRRPVDIPDLIRTQRDVFIGVLRDVLERLEERLR